MLKKILGWFLLSLPFIALAVLLGTLYGTIGVLIFGAALGIVGVLLGLIMLGVSLAFD